MSNFLLMPFGSSGDTYPLIGLGAELRRRGHGVTVFVNGNFKPAVERAGLDYVEAGTAADYLLLLKNPDIWDPRKGFKAIVGNPKMQELVRAQYALVEARMKTDPQLTVIAGSLAFGARIAEEKLGVRLAGTHLQPIMFMSEKNPPVAPQGRIPRWVPPIMMRFLYWFGDKYMLGPVIAEVVEPLRRDLGLPKASRYITEWIHTRQLALGLFPKWFGFEDDWPAFLRQTGFPLYDDGGDKPMPPDVDAYLDRGPAPIVFTFGTGMMCGEKLFAASAEACAILGRRGILLSPFRQQLPAVLPEQATHFNYIPLTRLLPRAAAIVHHGGIGTTSQALRAAVPQVITPLAHDQPDNAARVEKLGTGRALAVKNITGKKLAERLRQVLDDPRVRTACNTAAQRFENYNALAETCDILEVFAKTGKAPK